MISAKRGVRKTSAEDAARREENLKRDMLRLITNPLSQEDQAKSELGGEAIMALRSVHTAIQNIKADMTSIGKTTVDNGKEKALGDSVKRAVTALDPDRIKEEGHTDKRDSDDEDRCEIFCQSSIHIAVH